MISAFMFLFTSNGATVKKGDANDDGMGCDPGGLKSKIPVIVDAEGGPIYLCLSVEQLADCSQTDDLTECIKEGGITKRYNQRPHNLLATVKQIAVPSGAPLF